MLAKYRCLGILQQAVRMDVDFLGLHTRGEPQQHEIDSVSPIPGYKLVSFEEDCNDQNATTSIATTAKAMVS